MNDKISLHLVAVPSTKPGQVYYMLSFGSNESGDNRHEVYRTVAGPEDVENCADWARQLLAAVIEAL